MQFYSRYGIARHLTVEPVLFSSRGSMVGSVGTKLVSKDCRVLENRLSSYLNHVACTLAVALKHLNVDDDNEGLLLEE